jgi:hypothetical protein
MTRVVCSTTIQLIASHVNSLAPLHWYGSSPCRHRDDHPHTASLGRAGPHGRACHFFPSLQKTERKAKAALAYMVRTCVCYNATRVHPRCRLFDVSKQIVGQMFVHGVNVVVSDVGSTRTSRNACVYYFLNILLDTTLGTFRYLPCLSRSASYCHRCLRHLYYPLLPDVVPHREAKTQRAPVRPIRHTALPQLLGPPISHLRRLPHLHENVGRRPRLLLARSIGHRCVVAKLARQRRYRPGHLVRTVSA